jgi:hypothetical protein
MVPSFELDGGGVVGNLGAGRRRGTWPVEEGNGEVNQNNQKQCGKRHPERSAEPHPLVASVSLFVQVDLEIRHAQFIERGWAAGNKEVATKSKADEKNKKQKVKSKKHQIKS